MCSSCGGPKRVQVQRWTLTYSDGRPTETKTSRGLVRVAVAQAQAEGVTVTVEPPL